MTIHVSSHDDEDAFERELIAMGKRNVESNWTRTLSQAARRDLANRHAHESFKHQGKLRSRASAVTRPHTPKPKREATRIEIEHLYGEFMALAHTHAAHLAEMTFEEFASRVVRQREQVCRARGTRRLKMSVRLSGHRPVVHFKPL